MGQRSQIYIRYNIDYNGKRYTGLIPRYFSWNYGERMISRARALLEYIHYQDSPSRRSSPDFLLKIVHMCDVNFDMRDIVFSSNIIKEVQDYGLSVLFGQANNNGQLFIDVTNDSIKYCFTDYFETGNVMDAKEYMDWDYRTKTYPNWQEPNKYMDRETIDYTMRNIEAINSYATLMTREELKAFISDDYSYLLNPNTSVTGGKIDD